MSFADILLKNRRSLLTIDVNGILVETLYANSVLNERQYQIIKAEHVQLDGAAKLLDFVKASGHTGFVRFCEALKEDYSWMSEKLLHDAHELGLNFVGIENEQTEECPSVPAAVSQVIPTEKHLMKISKVLASTSIDKQSFMYELGLETSDIERCNNSNTVQTMQCMSALVFWLRKNGRSATFSALFDAAVNADLGNSCLKSLINIVTHP